MKKNVIVYSTPACAYCKLAKEFFRENSIEYQEIDVSADQKAADDMVQKSGQMGVPVIDIDGEIVVGFDKTKLSGLLGLAV